MLWRVDHRDCFRASALSSSEEHGWLRKIFSAVTGPYAYVRGYVTLYQFGTTDAFNAEFCYIPDGDSLTIWSGTNIIWDFTVAYTSNPLNTLDTRCPSQGGPLPNPDWGLGSRWSCASGNNDLASSSWNGTSYLFPTAPFGPSQSFNVTLPISTASIH